MMTVVTTTRLRPGGEDEWDAAVRARFESARDRPGWVSGQLLTPTEEPHTRVIVGTWQSRDDWEAWHHDPRSSNNDRRSSGSRSGAGWSGSRWSRTHVAADPPSSSGSRNASCRVAPSDTSRARAA